MSADIRRLYLFHLFNSVAVAVPVHPDLPGEHYRIYFTYCAMGFLLCGGLIAAVRDGHRTVTAAAGMQQAYRWMRTAIWRGQL